jgi:predicted phosphoribosyltransferase
VPIAAQTISSASADSSRQVEGAATPEPFVAVGRWYADFEQTTDEEVRALLEAAAREQAERKQGSAPAQGP